MRNTPRRIHRIGQHVYTETHRREGTCEHCGKRVRRNSGKKTLDRAGGIRYSEKRLKWLCVKCYLAVF